MVDTITQDERAELRELAQHVTPGPYFADGFDVQDCDDTAVARCNGDINDLQEDTQESFAHFIAAACNMAPRLLNALEITEALLDESCQETRANFSAVYQACTEIIPDLKSKLEAAEGRALTWTTEPPKETGFYWWKCDGHIKTGPQVAYVKTERFNLHSSGLEMMFIHHGPTYHHCDKCQWAGPIPTPREPEES